MIKNKLYILATLFVLSFNIQITGQNNEENDGNKSLMEAFEQTRGNEGQTKKAVVGLHRFNSQGKLLASEGAAGDQLGISVAVSGNTAIVGAFNDDVGANANQGSAYIFVRSVSGVWAQQAKLTAADGAANDVFGWSVSIDGDTVIVGADVDDSGSNANQGSAYAFALTANSPFDFDGDGKTDIGIFRPSAGEWWINRSSNGTGYALQFGASSDKLAPADFTGDGKADIAFWRPSNGFWFVLRSEDFSFYSFPFGTNGDVPTPGDYDGDGKFDAAVFRPSNVTWFVSKSTGGNLIQTFGAAGDQPLPNAFVP